MLDREKIEECYKKGAEMALRFSERTVLKAKKKIGFVMPWI